MINKLKALAVAAVVAIAPVAVSAATVVGTINISGDIDLAASTFDITGTADLADTGTVVSSTGDFAAFAPALSVVALTDIDFDAPGTVWSVGGFTFDFSAFALADFVDTAAFKFARAFGTITGNGFTATNGTLLLSAQGGATSASFSATTVVPVPAAGFLLIGALGALGVARRRKS